MLSNYLVEAWVFYGTNLSGIKSLEELYAGHIVNKMDYCLTVHVSRGGAEFFAIVSNCWRCMGSVNSVDGGSVCLRMFRFGLCPWSIHFVYTLRQLRSFLATMLKYLGGCCDAIVP